MFTCSHVYKSLCAFILKIILYWILSDRYWGRHYVMRCYLYLNRHEFQKSNQIMKEIIVSKNKNMTSTNWNLRKQLTWNATHSLSRINKYYNQHLNVLWEENYLKVCLSAILIWIFSTSLSFLFFKASKMLDQNQFHL